MIHRPHKVEETKTDGRGRSKVHQSCSRFHQPSFYFSSFTASVALVRNDSHRQSTLTYLGLSGFTFVGRLRCGNPPWPELYGIRPARRRDRVCPIRDPGSVTRQTCHLRLTDEFYAMYYLYYSTDADRRNMKCVRQNMVIGVIWLKL